MDGAFDLFLQRGCAAIPKLFEIESAVENRRGIYVAFLLVDANRPLTLVRAALGQQMATRAGDRVVVRQHFLVKKFFSQSDFPNVELHRQWNWLDGLAATNALHLLGRQGISGGLKFLSNARPHHQEQQHSRRTSEFDCSSDARHLIYMQMFHGYSWMLDS
jgi:hypothetical protein